MMIMLNVNNGCVIKRWEPLHNETAVIVSSIFPILRGPLSSLCAVFEIQADIRHIYLRICSEDEPIHRRLHPSLL